MKESPLLLINPIRKHFPAEALTVLYASTERCHHGEGCLQDSALLCCTIKVAQCGKVEN